MRPEERLRDALHDRADQVEVDLPRVRALTEEKLAAPRRRRAWPLLAAAAAVAVVAAGAAVLGRSGAPAPTHPPVVSGPHGSWSPYGPRIAERGGVATQFTCQHRSTVRFDPVAKNLSFVPSMEHGARWFAGQMQAPRFAVQVTGDSAILRLGNADGSLASISTLARVDGRWDPVRATKCVDDPTPTGLATRLGVHEFTPYPASAVARNYPRCSAPVFVDDRGYYDRAGLRRHQSLFALECPDGVVRLDAVAGVSPDGMAEEYLTVSVPASATPADVWRVLVPRGDPLHRGPLGLWALYDPHRQVANVTVALRDGTVRPAERVMSGSWPGPLFLVLAPRAQVTRLVVHPVHGAATTYSPTNPPGYRR